MKSWMTEKDYQQAGGKELGIGLNSAFILEIKEDNVEFRELLNEIRGEFKLASPTPSAAFERYLFERLSNLRDEIETYFALEEFYGGFQETLGRDNQRTVESLKQQHIDLFLRLDQIVESTEQLVYEESNEISLSTIGKQFESFYSELQVHEEFEMDVIMRSCNEVLGTGD